MKQIGIKLADGTFYPVLEEGTPSARQLDLTTVKDNQTKVQIDVYRSETGTMDDAEYVDTLEVTKLNPHPNGEPDLHLSLGLDENNELKAEVIDGETGKKSEIQVQLVSRTLAERESSAPDFNVETSVDPADVPPVDETDVPFSFDTADIPSESGAEPASDTFEIPDFDSLQGGGLAPKHTPVSGDFDLPDFDDLDAAAGETAAEETGTGSDLDLPDFDAPDALAADESAAVTADEGASLAAAAAADEGTLADSSLDLPDFDGLDLGGSDDASSVGPSAAEETAAPADTEADSFGSLDLPDFDSLDVPESPVAAVPAEPETAPAADAPAGDPLAAFDLPDFDSTDSSDLSSDSSNGISLDDFDLPDFGSSTPFGDSSSFDDLLFDDDTAPKSPAPAASAPAAPAMDFSDLYDKETLAGKSSGFGDYDDEDEVHKTRVPVIICVVCAIICIIATALILFIIPSRYNLISSRNTKNQPVVAEQAEELDSKPSAVSALPAPAPEPVPEPAPVAPAVEDKIVVAPSPEAVVPEPVTVKETTPAPKKKADVTYRIKWGDTLWDISDAYYNNPWRYPKIANYNHIPNPDLIISGTDILIPAE